MQNPHIARNAAKANIPANKNPVIFHPKAKDIKENVRNNTANKLLKRDSSFDSIRDFAIRYNPQYSD